jgi:signal transduction histidine kinase/DNA-binding response OmpR family regulator/CHASE3 domain sensor protein
MHTDASSPSPGGSAGTPDGGSAGRSGGYRPGRLPLPRGPLAGFVLAVLAVLVIAAATLRASQESARTAQWVDHTYRVTIEVRNVLGALKDAETGQRGFLMAGNEEYLVTYRQGEQMLPRALARLAELVSDNPEQTERVERLRQLAELRLGEIANVIRLQRQGDREGVLDVFRTNRAKTRMDELRRGIADIQLAEGRLLTERQAALEHAQTVSVVVTLAGAGVLLAVLFSAALATSRDFRLRERENWLRQSLAELSAALQGARGVAGVGAVAVGYLARRSRAAVGAFYGRQGDTATLALQGGYALGEGAPAQVEPGQGLVGQCAAEGRLAVYDDVPERHLQLVSASGRSAPRTLVLAPAVIEQQSEAVVELGFFGPAREEVLELLRRAEFVLALAVRNARERERTEALLAQTQQQAEELQAQQEELRVANEELEEQTHALQQSQAELETQQMALSATNVQLEERTLHLEEQRRTLLQAQHALETASRYKTEFLANMSHELRTPLNSSLILAKLLADNRDGHLGEEQVKYARAILSSNNDLLALINDILDLSKIEAGHLDLMPEPLPLEAVLGRMRETFEPLARQKGLELAVQAQPDAPATLVCDPQRLQQILKNLLSNAIKFTDKGRVALTVRAAAGGRVEMEVADSGIGIAADQQQLIFEAFQQADGSTSRRYGGTGLGLTISRELAQRMGGDIRVASTPGQGSRFTLHLPVDIRDALAAAAPQPASAARAAAGLSAEALPTAGAPAPLAAPDDAPDAAHHPVHAPAHLPLGPVTDDRGRPQRPGRLVLAVEDDAAFAQALVALAHELDFDCAVARTAQEALRLARELRPCGILLDIGLPDASGLSVLEQLKRDPATRHVPVHMVSGFDHAQTALEMGAVGHVLKPADRDTLAHAFTELEARLQHRVRRLLIVEDDLALRENLALMLAAEGLEITGVSTVAEALQQLGTTTFDCMVTDLALPDGTGYALLEKMAANEGLSFPPVIVYTGRALTRDEEQALRRYSKSIIVKGARSPERLLDEVTLFLHSVEEALPPSQRQMLTQARRRDTVLEGRTILLAEDDVRNIFALSSVLEPLGVKLEIARNGQEAIDRLQQRDVDLVLMDIMMPEMDGLTAIRLIRERPDWRSLPIIALTAKAMPDDRRACIEAGANDYIAKPLDIDRLVSLCRVWCPK